MFCHKNFDNHILQSSENYQHFEQLEFTKSSFIIHDITCFPIQHPACKYTAKQIITNISLLISQKTVCHMQNNK